MKNIRDIQLMASMAPPGGGRNAFSQRIMSVFATLNMTNPSDAQLHRIYATLLNHHLRDFDDRSNRWATRSSKPRWSCTLHRRGASADAEQVALPVQHARPREGDPRLRCRPRGVLRRERSDPSAVVPRVLPRVRRSHVGPRRHTPGLRTSSIRNCCTCWEAPGSTLFEPFYGECPPFVSFMRADVDDPPYEAVVDPRRLKDLLAEKLEEYAIEPGNTRRWTSCCSATRSCTSAACTACCASPAATRCWWASAARGRKSPRAARHVRRRAQVLLHRDHQELPPVEFRED